MTLNFSTVCLLALRRDGAQLHDGVPAGVGGTPWDGPLDGGAAPWRALLAGARPGRLLRAPPAVEARAAAVAGSGASQRPAEGFQIRSSAEEPLIVYVKE